jgi:G3E family GTPase
MTQEAAPPHRPVTVHLLTGFLGSGKTTLLKRLLAEPDLRDTAVLINEFGEVGLDHLLVEEVDPGEVVLLRSGCVCCSIRGDLRDGLERLLGRMRRGEVPPFGRVVVETTGLADPVPIVASFAADPSLRYHFRLGHVVTVVDAVNGRTNLRDHPEAVKQVALADRLVVSKADLVGAGQVARLRERLAALNPTAALCGAASGTDLLLEDAQDPAGRDGEVRRWLAAARDGAAPHHHRHHRPHDDGAGGPATFCLTAEEPVDWAVFGLWLSMLLNRHGGDILRLKGLLRVRGVDRPVVIQGVQHLVHAPTHLDAWPEGRPATRLVVIGRGFDRAAIERSFRAFHRLGRRETGEPPPSGSRSALSLVEPR